MTSPDPATLSPAHTEAVLGHAISVTCFSILKAFNGLLKDYPLRVDGPDWWHWQRYVQRELREGSRRWDESA